MVMPPVHVGSFMNRPKWRKSPVRRWEALECKAAIKMGTSLGGRSKEQDLLVAADTTRALWSSISRRGRHAGYFSRRLCLASSTAGPDVTMAQYPLAAGSKTREALPAGLCAAVNSTCASRNGRYTVYPGTG